MSEDANATDDARRAETKKGCIGCLVILLGFIVLGVLCSDESPPPPAPRPEAPPQASSAVSAATWTEGEWPLTIDQGTLVCFPPFDAIYFVDPQGRLWPLNGFASAQGERRGAEPDLVPIWKEDERMYERSLGPEYTPEDLASLKRELGGSVHIGIGPLTDRAFQLCQ